MPLAARGGPQWRYATIQSRADAPPIFRRQQFHQHRFDTLVEIRRDDRNLVEYIMHLLQSVGPRSRRFATCPTRRRPRNSDYAPDEIGVIDGKGRHDPIGRLLRRPVDACSTVLVHYASLGQMKAARQEVVQFSHQLSRYEAAPFGTFVLEEMTASHTLGVEKDLLIGR